MILDLRRPALWMWLNACVILGCLASVIQPSILHAGPFVAGAAVFAAVYFVLLIRRHVADGTGTATLGDLHADLKRGRRLPRYPLENAAVIALVASTIYAASGHAR